MICLGVKREAIALSLLLTLCIMVGDVITAKCKDPAHGCVPMGITIGCDDGVTDLDVDWNQNNSAPYTCWANETTIKPNKKLKPILDENMKSLGMIHVCMNTTLTYNTTLGPPTSGRHRPVMPKYGDYKYIPTERWLHVLEHGALAFLYHPCASPMLIRMFSKMADACMNKHVLTPYRHLKRDRPFAVVAFRNRMQMSVPKPKLITKFARKHALRGLENILMDGTYDVDLIKQPKTLVDLPRNKLCSFKPLMKKMKAKMKPKMKKMKKKMKPKMKQLKNKLKRKMKRRAQPQQ